MRAIDEVHLLGYLPFLYVAAAGLAVLPGDEVGVALVTFLLAVALTAVARLEPRWGSWIGGAGTVALSFELVVALVSPGWVGAVGNEMAWGTLLAGPLIVFANLARTGESTATRLIGLEVALAYGILLLSAPTVLSSLDIPVSAASLVNGTFRSLDAQLAGVGHLFLGQPGGSLPMRAVNDPWFAGLASLAVLVTFLSFVRPSTGRDVELPTLERGGPRAPVSDPAVLPGLSPQFRELLDARSVPRGAPSGVVPGAVALFTAGLAGALLFGVVYAVPALAILGATAAALFLVAAVLVVLGRSLV